MLEIGQRLRNTLSEYRRQAEHRLKPHLGQMLLADLRPTDILAMLDDLRKPGADRRSKTPKGLSETTLQHTLQALRTALDWGVRHRLVAYNQAKDVDRPRRERKEMAVWTANELSRFMGFVSTKRFYPLLRLAAFTGMRRSELLGLLWRDVDLDAAVVRVRRVRLKDGYVMFTEERTKSARGRRAIDLDAVTVGALRRWADDQSDERGVWGIAYTDSGAAFTTEDGLPLHSQRSTAPHRAPPYGKQIGGLRIVAKVSAAAAAKGVQSTASLNRRASGIIDRREHCSTPVELYADRTLRVTLSSPVARGIHRWYESDVP